MTGLHSNMMLPSHKTSKVSVKPASGYEETRAKTGIPIVVEFKHTL